MTEYNEIRLDEKNEADDIVITCDSVHIERMSVGSWWIGIYKDGKRVCLNLSADSRIDPLVTENELGAEIVPYGR